MKQYLKESLLWRFVGIVKEVSVANGDKTCWIE